MATMMKEKKSSKAAVPLADKAAKTIGARLRFLRKSQKVRLLDLSKSSGVDAATISRIETGRMTGTLESHIRLANALGVKITQLYEGIEEERQKGAVSLSSASSRGDVYVHQAGKSAITMLTTDILRKKLMPALITIEPGGSTHKEEAKVGTEKFLYVLEGSLQAHVGDSVHELKHGSSLYLDASIAHSLKNVGTRSARCLSIVTPPVL